MAFRIDARPPTAGTLALAMRVDTDRMIDLHAVGGALDHMVGRLDDVLCRAEVLDEEGDLALVVRLEAADELDAGTLERVDVLVVVTDGHDAQPPLGIGQAPPGQRADQAVLPFVDVLVLVDEDVLVALQQAVACLVRVGEGVGPAFEQVDGVLNQLVEIDRGTLRGRRPPGWCPSAAAPWRGRSAPSLRGRRRRRGRSGAGAAPSPHCG